MTNQRDAAEAVKLSELIRTRLLGVSPDDQDLQLEDHDWKLILQALASMPSDTKQEKLQHVAYFDEGQFHWMSGIAPRDCELYATWPSRARQTGES